MSTTRCVLPLHSSHSPTEHVHTRVSMEETSTTQYEHFFKQQPTLCVCLSGEYRSIILYIHTFIQSTYICTCLGITCTLDLLESMCPPRGVSCPSTHHIHRQSMSIPKNVSVSQYGGNINNAIRTFLEQQPTLCVFVG